MGWTTQERGLQKYSEPRIDLRPDAGLSLGQDQPWSTWTSKPGMDLDLDLDPYLQAWDEPGSKPGFLPPDQGGLYTTWLTVNTLSYSPASQLISTFLRFVLLVTLHDMSCEFSTVKFYNRPDSNQPTLFLSVILTDPWMERFFIYLVVVFADRYSNDQRRFCGRLFT